MPIRVSRRGRGRLRRPSAQPGLRGQRLHEVGVETARLLRRRPRPVAKYEDAVDALLEPVPVAHDDEVPADLDAGVVPLAQLGGEVVRTPAVEHGGYVSVFAVGAGREVADEEGAFDAGFGPGWFGERGEVVDHGEGGDGEDGGDVRVVAAEDGEVEFVVCALCRRGLGRVF